MLNHLVTHALPLAHGEWLEMFRLFEGVVLCDESFRDVSLGTVPIVLAVIRVMIVDPDDGVGLNFVPFNEQNHDYPHQSLCHTCNGRVPVSHVRDDGAASGADCLVEGGLKVGKALLVSEAKVGTAEDTPDLSPDLCLHPRPSRDVDKSPDGKIGDGAVSSENVLDGIEGVVKTHFASGVLTRFDLVTKTLLTICNRIPDCPDLDLLSLKVR